MVFQDRESAALKLAEKLNHYRQKNVIVAGIPRGAMPMARIIADHLSGEVSAVLVHKISAAHNEEFAIGSVGLSGKVYLRSYAHSYVTSEEYINQAAARELKRLRERQRMYGLGHIDFQGRIVVVVDDGIATGATTRAAIQEVRTHKPLKIILAAPVSSSEAAHELRRMVDEFVLLHEAPDMYAIGQYYRHFPQVSDEEVIRSLVGAPRASSRGGL